MAEREKKSGLEGELLELYHRLWEPEPEICACCRDENSAQDGPLGAWMVGKCFAAQSCRVLFVGKVARGKMEGSDDYGSFQVGFVSARSLWNSRKWAFWSYTQAIAQQLFPAETLEGCRERIAMTNLVRCNHSPTTDKTSDSMKRHCVLELQVFSREVKILRPTHIVLYTGNSYDIVKPWGLEGFTEIRTETVPVGKRGMPWLEATAVVDGEAVHMLRVGHPERKGKAAFVEMVTQWVRRTVP